MLGRITTDALQARLAIMRGHLIPRRGGRGGRRENRVQGRGARPRDEPVVRGNLRKSALLHEQQRAVAVSEEIDRGQDRGEEHEARDQPEQASAFYFLLRGGGVGRISIGCRRRHGSLRHKGRRWWWRCSYRRGALGSGGLGGGDLPIKPIQMIADEGALTAKFGEAVGHEPSLPGGRRWAIQQKRRTLRVRL